MTLLSSFATLGPPVLLVCLAIIGFAVFVAYFVLTFTESGTGEEYLYSCPLSTMWAGLATMWYSTVFLLWWWLSGKYGARKTDTRSGLLALRVWVAVGAIFAAEGFVAMVGWAVADNEGAAAGLSTLWIISGMIGSLMCFFQMRKKLSSESADKAGVSDSFEEDGENRENTNNAVYSPASKAFDTPADDRSEVCASDEHIDASKEKCCRACRQRCRCCCTAEFWIDFSFLFLAAFLLFFSTGITIQSAQTASDASLTPPGSIFHINANGVDLQMHLFCFGGDTNSGDLAATVIFEHGGGANSMTVLGLAKEVESVYGNRVCVYDRLGYGFTPSLYTSSGEEGTKTSLPNTGVLLSKLLTAAGESGPYVCAGHSAGAEVCLWFAHEQGSDVTGVAMMDGYPDLIRAGTFRPAQPADDSILGSIQTFAVLAGATGFTRGLVGDPGPDFVPESEKATSISLYGQVRFWLAQYWDVRADLGLDEGSRLYKQLGGAQDEVGLYHYGGTLSGVKVLVLPARATYDELDCDLVVEKNQEGVYCCGHAKDSTQCKNERVDTQLYRNQTHLYASTLSDVLGTVVVAPEGSEHDFVYHRDYYQWVASQIGEQLLS